MDVLEELSFFHTETLQALSIGLINCQYLIDMDLLTGNGWSKTGEMYLIGGEVIYRYNKHNVYYENTQTSGLYRCSVRGIQYLYNHLGKIYGIFYKTSKIENDTSLVLDDDVLAGVVGEMNTYINIVMGKYFTYMGEKYKMPQYICNAGQTVVSDKLMKEIPEDVEPNTAWIINGLPYNVGTLIPYDEKYGVEKYTIIERTFIPLKLTNIPDIQESIKLSDILFRPEKIASKYGRFIDDDKIV